MNNSREKSGLLKFAIGLICIIVGLGGLAATLCGGYVIFATGGGLNFTSHGSFDVVTLLVWGSFLGGALIIQLAFMWWRSTFRRPARGTGETFDDSDESSATET